MTVPAKMKYKKLHFLELFISLEESNRCKWKKKSLKSGGKKQKYIECM